VECRAMPHDGHGHCEVELRARPRNHSSRFSVPLFPIRTSAARDEMNREQ
jgi:hypothetical protein